MEVIEQSQIDISNEPVLTNKFGEQYLYSVNADSLLEVESKTLYNSLFKQQLWQEDFYNVIIGTDSGLLVQHIFEHGIPENSRFVFIELPQYIELIRPEIPAQWQEQIMFCTPDEWLNGFNNEGMSCYLYTGAIRVFRCLAEVYATNQQYHQVYIDAQYYLDGLIFRTNAAFGNLNFVEMQIGNCADNIQPMALLRGAFKGRSCVILGGGPSLDNDLQWVINNREKLLVIAVSRISKRLINVGLIPDIVCSIDPQQLSFELSKESLEFDEKVLLINANHVAPALLGQWSGQSVYIGQRLPWDSTLNQTNVPLAGPTVANSALCAAIEFGCSNIYLAGVDLCYRRDGLTHAKDSAEAARGNNLSRYSVWVDTYSGQKVETIMGLVIAADVLAEQTKIAKSLGIKVFNLSKHALIVEGIEHCLTSDVELELPGFDASQVFESYLKLPSKELIFSDNEKVKCELERFKQLLLVVKKLILDASMYNETLHLPSASIEKRQKAKRKIDKIDKQLANKYQLVSKSIKQIAIKDFVKLLSTQKKSQWSEQQIFEKGQIYYQAYLNGISSFLTHIETAQQRLSFTNNLVNDEIEFESLIDQWQTNQEFGRVKRWQQYYTGVITNPERQQLIALDKKKEIYYDQLNKKCTNTRKLTLKRVPVKLKQLFDQKNPEGLAVIIEMLQAVNYEEAKAQHLANLGQAYQCILFEQKTQAINAFYQTDWQQLDEFSFKLLANLLIEDGQLVKAETVLELLAQQSVNSLNLYAQILWANRKRDEAIDAYSRYLEKYPNDYNGWINLARIFVAIGAYDSARMAYSHVLQLSPNFLLAQDGLAQLAEIERASSNE